MSPEFELDDGGTGSDLDPDFYRWKYPDIRFHNDAAAGMHYRDFGKAEGRYPNAESMIRSILDIDPHALPNDFNSEDYLAANSDAVNELNFEHAETLHYLLFAHERDGVPRRWTSDLQLDFYRGYYPDLSGFDDEGLVEHYLRFGRHEGRFPNVQSLVDSYAAEHGIALPETFNEATYLEANPDVSRHYQFHGAGAVHYVTVGHAEGRSGPWRSFDEAHLHLMTNRIHDLPDVVVDATQPTRVNVLVPAFDFASMSAGFFGVFQVARYIASLGHQVRLVLFDNFAWNEHEMRQRLLQYPGLESLLDEVECEYIGERLTPLQVSPHDTCVATVWYSAYFARHIMKNIGGGPFIYLIQDYESAFYASSAMWSFADHTYDFDYWALISSESLARTLQQRGIGRFATEEVHSIHFNNAAAARLPSIDDFITAHASGKRRLVFYSRPQVHRNMFELGALAVIRAVREGVLSPEEWDFFGVGLGETSIELSGGHRMTTLPRMTLAEYQATISTFDVGLCLMASPHPSLLPFDLAGSGAVVVTNTFGLKNQSYFDDLVSGLVIAADPTVDAVVEGLRHATAMVADSPARHQAARSMTYPTSWSDTFTSEHRDFINAAVAAAHHH